MRVSQEEGVQGEARHQKLHHSKAAVVNGVEQGAARTRMLGRSVAVQGTDEKISHTHTHSLSADLSFSLLIS